MAPPRIPFLLDLQDILAIHERLVRDQEESTRGILSLENLDMCVSSPDHRVFGIEPYDDLIKKGAKLAFEIVSLHPFIDGNKRTALAAISTLFEMNGCSLIVPSKEAVRVMVGVASGNMTYEDLLHFVEEHVVRKTNDQ